MGVMLGWTSGIQVHFCLRLCEWNCTHPYKISSIVRLNNRLEGKVNTFLDIKIHCRGRNYDLFSPRSMPGRAVLLEMIRLLTTSNNSLTPTN